MGRQRRLGLATGLVAVAAGAAIAIVVSSSGQGPRRARPPSRSAPVATSATAAPAPPTTSASTAAPTAPPANSAPALPAPPGERFGASVNLLFNMPGVAAQLIDRQLTALRASGATLARSDALWEATEPVAPSGAVHHYTWAFDDHVAGTLAAHHLQWLPILDYSAPWAQSIPGQDHSPPRSDADYATYAAAFAARYGSGGRFWRSHPQLVAEPVSTYEIWNEPDNGEFWTPRGDPAAYGDLYAAARSAIDGVDPSARVLIGGLTIPGLFLPALLTDRPALRGHIDGVAVHPYGPPATVLGKLAADRATLTSLGMGSVALYATEFGWTIQPPGALNYAPATLRPQYILQTLAELGQRECGLAAAVLYTWYSPRENPADSSQWYGINDPGNGSPDTAAFAAGVHEGARTDVASRPCG